MTCASSSFCGPIFGIRRLDARRSAVLVFTRPRDEGFRRQAPYRIAGSVARLPAITKGFLRGYSMADQAFQNVINGELVDSVSGETYDVIDPTTGEVYATAPMSGAEDVDRAYAAAAEAFEAWGDTHAPGPRDRAAQDRRRDRGAGRGVQRGRVQGHRQAARADDVGGDALRLRPLPVLRRRRAGARGQVGGRVHGGPHLVRSAASRSASSAR